MLSPFPLEHGLREGIPELWQAKRRDVGEIAILDIGDHRFAYLGCNGKVRICCRERNHVFWYLGPAVVVCPFPQNGKIYLFVIEAAQSNP